jgi:twitching motility two-component system response regulator PilG
MMGNLTPLPAKNPPVANKTDSKSGAIAYPRKVIKHLVTKGASGCITLYDPQNHAVSWNLYIRKGQLTYASSAVRKGERLQCLIRNIQPDLSQIEFSKDQSEYTTICQWWYKSGLPMAQLRKLLLNLSLEALVQILALPKAIVEFNRASKIEPILIETPLNPILPRLWPMALQWQKWRTTTPSPFTRLYLKPDRDRSFRQMWQQHPYCIKNKPCGERWMVRLSHLLSKKLSIYQIAYYLKVSAVTLVDWLQPYINAKIVLLWDNRTAARKAAAPELSPVSELPLTAAPISSLPPLDAGFPSSDSIRHRVACIDDSKTIQKQVKGILELSGFEVVGITEPARALSSLVRQKPAVILMDVNMPDIDGYELCTMLRQSRQLRDIPIIMLTGRDGILDRIRAKTLGVNCYLTKPFNPEHLIEHVQSVLQGLPLSSSAATMTP